MQSDTKLEKIKPHIWPTFYNVTMYENNVCIYCMYIYCMYIVYCMYCVCFCLPCAHIARIKFVCVIYVGVMCKNLFNICRFYVSGCSDEGKQSPAGEKTKPTDCSIM